MITPMNVWRTKAGQFIFTDIGSEQEALCRANKHQFLGSKDLAYHPTTREVTETTRVLVRHECRQGINIDICEAMLPSGTYDHQLTYKRRV